MIDIDHFKPSFRPLAGNRSLKGRRLGQKDRRKQGFRPLAGNRNLKGLPSESRTEIGFQVAISEGVIFVVNKDGFVLNKHPKKALVTQSWQAI